MVVIIIYFVLNDSVEGKEFNGNFGVIVGFDLCGICGWKRDKD